MQGGGRCRPDRRGPPPPPEVRVGDVRFFLVLPDCARHMRNETATVRAWAVAPCCESRSNGPGIVHATLY
eukprot:444243-Prymnesium_polylepis.2